MVKKIAAVAGGVLIGLFIAFARVGAFPFWGSDSDASKAPPRAASASKPAGTSAGTAGARRSGGATAGARRAEYA